MVVGVFVVEVVVGIVYELMCVGLVLLLLDCV